MMWNEVKRQRFYVLRERATQGALTTEETTELKRLYHELEEMEAAYLRPAMGRKRQEAEKLRAINTSLRDVVRRREEHLARMQATFGGT